MCEGKKVFIFYDILKCACFTELSRALLCSTNKRDAAFYEVRYKVLIMLFYSTLIIINKNSTKL